MGEKCHSIRSNQTIKIGLHNKKGCKAVAIIMVKSMLANISSMSIEKCHVIQHSMLDFVNDERFVSTLLIQN